MKPPEVFGSNGHLSVKSPPHSGHFYLPPSLKNKTLREKQTNKQTAERQRKKTNGFPFSCQNRMSKATEYRRVDGRQCTAWRGAPPRHSKPTETENELMDVFILTENRFKKVQEPLRELQVFQFRHLLCAWLFYLRSRRKQKPYCRMLAVIPPHCLLSYIQRNKTSPTFATGWKIEQ